MAEQNNGEEDDRDITPAIDVINPSEEVVDMSGATIIARDDEDAPAVPTSSSPATIMKLNSEQLVPEVAVEKGANNHARVDQSETVDFKVIYKKQKYDVTFPLDDTVAALKQHMQTLTGVPAVMQKVMFKGLAKEEKSLRELGVVAGTKLMVVGSTLNDILAVNTPSTQEGDKDDKEEATAAATKEPLCKQKMHKKIIDKGLPDDIMPGIKNERDSLPPFPLSGMLNKGGGKVRLTFKLEVDQLWIGTKERTDKIPMNSIKNVTSEPIEGHEEYHILGIQLGPTEASRYWVYWVPSQYIEAIKDAIFGKWQTF